MSLDFCDVVGRLIDLDAKKKKQISADSVSVAPSANEAGTDGEEPFRLVLKNKKKAEAVSPG